MLLYNSISFSLKGEILNHFCGPLTLAERWKENLMIYCWAGSVVCSTSMEGLAAPACRGHGWRSWKACVTTRELWSCPTPTCMWSASHTAADVILHLRFISDCYWREAEGFGGGEGGAMQVTGEGLSALPWFDFTSRS